MYICIYIHVYTYIFTYIHTYIYICICIYICIYIYIRTYIHVHMYTRAFSFIYFILPTTISLNSIGVMCPMTHSSVLWLVHAWHDLFICAVSHPCEPRHINIQIYRLPMYMYDIYTRTYIHMCISMCTYTIVRHDSIIISLTTIFIKETYQRNQQKRPNDSEKRPTKETIISLTTICIKETYKRDLPKRPTKET